MPEEWIERTQQTLGTLITKPKLGDKYLVKPPFRFLHDALTETIRATGFGQGLYTDDELDAGKISEGGKQAKLDFLNKMVSCVCFALGEKLDVSANKIVAGLEPEKTNAFLVKLYEAATTKLDTSPDAVMRVMQGESAVAEKKPKEKKDKKDEKPEEASGGADDEQAKLEEERKRREEKKRRAEKKAAEEEAAKKKEEDAAAAAEKAKQDAAVAKEDERRQEKKRREEKKRQEEEQRRQAEEEQKAEEKRRKKEQAAAAAAAAPPPAQADEDAPVEEERKDLPIVSDDMRKRERPLTAGRKPPKITSKVKEQKEEPGMQAAPKAPAPQFITEGFTGDDEEDMFIADEAPKPAASEMLIAGGDQGKLVRELMQEKEKAVKEAEQPKEEDKKDEQKSGIRMGKLKRRQDATGSAYAEVDVAQLGQLTQQLCSQVNPLGKSVDMIYQDIASMSKELDMWRAEYRSATERQQVEREGTEKEMAPFHAKVAALDDKIAEKQAQITAMRARIYQNDCTIQQLLETIAYPGN